MKRILNNQTLCIFAHEILGVIKLTETKTQFENSGIISKFVLVLQEYLGFRYEITTVTGLELATLVIENSIDLFFPVPQISKFLDYVDFTRPITIEGIKYIVRKPAELSKVTAIVRPFSINMWIAIAFSFVISTIIFCIMFRKDAELNKRKKVKFNEIAWALFGSFTAKGNDLFFPSGKCCRLLVSGWLLATFIITSSYSGALMSFITFPGRESAPRTFSQLMNMVRNGDYKLGTVSLDEIEFSIAKFPGKIGRDFTQFLKLNKIEEISMDENLANRMNKEKFAYISLETLLNIFVSNYGQENFLFSEEQLVSFNVRAGMSKIFPYKKHINKAILRLNEAGILEKFKNDEILEAVKKRRSIFQENTDILRPLNITDLSGPLFLLVAGYALSIAIFFMEITVNKLFL